MPADRVESLLEELTLDEKLSLVRGAPDPDGEATGYLPGVERLDVPPLKFVDGPLGVRAGESTAFPATIALGAAWDPDVASDVGNAIATEASAKGMDVLLAPGVNLVRVPLCGRNFEYVSEDPLLSGVVGAGYASGVEDAGVTATVKHFVANNQEENRNHVDVDVSERALRECYLPPFRRVVDADVGSVMAAYNRVDGTYMTAHDELLRDVLRVEWNFDGVVVSDWWATHDGEAAAEAGLDVEMPGISVVELFAPSNRLANLIQRFGLSRLVRLEPPLVERLSDLLSGNGQPDPFEFGAFGSSLRSAIERGDVPQSTLDRKVRRVLELYERVGAFEDQDRPRVDDLAHRDLAHEAAVAGSVLLKNAGGSEEADSVLPLSDESVAVIGPNADRPKLGGGGSSEVTPGSAISALDGIRERARGNVQFERGTSPIPEPSMFDPPWAGASRRIRGVFDGSDRDDAVEAARDADVAVVVVQDDATEGADHESMVLPSDQDDLVAAVAAVAPTVVVCQSGGPVAMPWIDDVDAALQVWYPGQEGGRAIADVLWGKDPGGRLPVTFGHSFEDYPVSEERRYPGVDDVVHYDEGVFVGHRAFDADGIEPLFPFGHGESYAEFEYSDLAVETDDGGVTATVTVENVADRAGTEIVQAYAEPPESPVERPPRELAGFERVDVDAGEKRTVSLSLGSEALAVWDDGWLVPDGAYTVCVGRSSRDVRERATVDLPGAEPASPDLAAPDLLDL